MSWLTVAEAKAHLDAPSDTSVDDEELFGFIEAAEGMVDDLIGTVRPTVEPHVEYHDACGGRSTLVLRECPVAAIVSVEVIGGDTIAQADLDEADSIGWFASDLEMGAGLVRHTCCFPLGRRVKVAYHPGRLLIPGNVRLATLELVAHLWQSSQNGMAGSGSNRLGNSPTSEEPLVFRGYALPNRVRELLGLGKRARDEQQVG